MIRAIPTDETSELALHEAGHAAVALDPRSLERRPRPTILYVTIEPGRQGAAQIQFKKGSYLPLKGHEMACIAGIAAQVYGCLKRNRGADPVAAFAEYEERSRHDLGALEKRYGIRNIAVLDLVGRCMRWFDPIWPRVEALAGELAKHRTLYHEEAAWIFDAAKARLAIYRTFRKTADPHPKWLEGFAPGKAGPWFEDPTACLKRVCREALGAVRN